MVMIGVIVVCCVCIKGGGLISHHCVAASASVLGGDGELNAFNLSAVHQLLPVRYIRI